MAEDGRFPHLAEFRKGVHHIYFFKLIQAPQVLFLWGFFCFIGVIWTIYLTELSHVVQVRAEGPKAPSPGHRPGYNGNQQGAL